MAETRKRWYRSEPVVVTCVSFALVLAATAGFRLMAATWPAAPIIATILFATFYLWFFRVRWRAWRKARLVKRRAPTPDAPS